MKRYLSIFGLLIILGLAIGFIRRGIDSDPRDFKYLNMQCGLYDRSMKLVYFIANYIHCDFGPQGMVLAADDIKEKITLFDAHDNVLWETNEITHHWPKFSDDGQSLLVLRSEKKYLPGDGRTMLDACVTKRNLKNEMSGRWCLSEHFQDLKKYDIDPWGETLASQRLRGIHRNVFEISHMNSVFEIPDNETAAKNSAFSKGNILVNAYTPTLSILILDKDLKNLLWAQKLNDIEFGLGKYEFFVHAPRVLANGNILMYVNRIRPQFALKGLIWYAVDLLNFRYDSVRLQQPVFEEPFSMLVEYDPLQKKVVWHYNSSPRASFFSSELGVVNVLRNGNYLFSMNNQELPNTSDKGGRAVIIDRSGRVLWEQANLRATSEMGHEWLINLKPLYDESFIEARGLDKKF